MLPNREDQRPPAPEGWAPCRPLSAADGPQPRAAASRRSVTAWRPRVQRTLGRRIAPACRAVAGLLVSAAVGAAAQAGHDTAVRGSWTGVPLRRWVESVGRATGIPVVLDRRIDPDSPVTIHCEGEPLETVVARVASSAGAEMATLRSSLRIVPRDHAQACQRAERARDAAISRMPAADRRRLSASDAWSWPDAARPRDLVATLAGESRLGVLGIEAIPHDLFPAASLPPLTVAERFDLVLAHFDRRIAWTAGGGSIVPLEDVESTAATPRRDTSRVRPRTPTNEVAADPRFSMRFEAPLEQVLAAVAARLGLALDLDRSGLRARGIDPAEIVRGDFTDVSRDRLLDGILRPRALAWRIDGTTLSISAAP